MKSIRPHGLEEILASEPSGYIGIANIFLKPPSVLATPSEHTRATVQCGAYFQGSAAAL